MEFTQVFYNSFSNLAVIGSILVLSVYLILHKKSRLVDFGIALILAVSASEGLKFFFNTSRPESLLSIEGGSFPSTHTTIAYTVFFFYLVVCHSLSRGKGLNFKELSSKKELTYFILLFMLSFAAGMLRLLAVAHYLIDIIAGIILGLIISLLFTYYDFAMRRIK